MIKALLRHFVEQEPKISFIKQCLFLSWIFFLCAFLYDLNYPNDTYWFQRFGAVMCMLAVAAEFRLNQLDRNELIEDWEKRIKGEINLDSSMFIESLESKVLKFISHATLFFGTAIWAFGDKIVCFFLKT